jgi:phosphohistidine phosphatase
MKNLILLRHAAAQLYQYGENDHDRSISLEGMRELDGIKKKIKEKNKDLSEISLVLCSNTKRCRQTFDGLRSIFPSSAEMIFEDNLYQASAKMIEDRLRHVKSKHQTVLIIAHNPGLVDILNASSLSRSYRESFQFPTCSFCFMNLPITRWEEFSISISQFNDFLTAH